MATKKNKVTAKTTPPEQLYALATFGEHQDFEEAHNHETGDYCALMSHELVTDLAVTFASEGIEFTVYKLVPVPVEITLPVEASVKVGK